MNNFFSKIKNFNELSASIKIDYFVYFLTVINGKEGIKSSDIEMCFDELKTTKYSNISSYLKSNSKKNKNKSPKFIFKNGVYHLERAKKSELDDLLGITPPLTPTDNYFPLELFANTRGYLESIASQSLICYDTGMYDACSVMTRKLLEVLIIEAFERHKISEKIKDNNDNFFFFSDLIERFRIESKWNISRNAKESIPKLKKMGDLSAHNRRYVARKADVDKLKDDLRIVLEELIHIIDYLNWK